MFRTTAAVLTAGALLTASCSLEGEHQTSPNNPEAQAAFTSVQNHWTQKGMGEVASTQLVTLRERNDRFICNLNEPTDKNKLNKTIQSTARNTVASYCRGDNTVVVVESNFNGWMESANKIIDKDTFRRMVLAHEIGHRVAHVRGEMPPYNVKTSELRAECYMGETMASLDPAGLPKVLALIDKEPDFDTHGTAKERVKAIQAGANDATGKVCGTYS